MTGPKKVLLVEDEFVLYDEMAEFFEKQGFLVAGKTDDGKPLATYEEAIEVLHREEPDLAVLDIQLKSKKDGLEIGAYIKKHFNIPIVFLSAFDNFENLERAKVMAADGFVVKIDKPVNKKQLWATVSLVLPQIEQNRKRRAMGRFLKVKEIDLSQLERKIKAAHQPPADPVELETFVKWEDIKMIVSSNKLSNNNILLYTQHQNKGYFYRSTLSEIEAVLPEYFVRFNHSTLVNIHAITAKGKTAGTYYIGDSRLDMSESCRETALAKLNLYLEDKL